MNKIDREHIQKDVYAVEHAKTAQTAQEASLLLRNDIYLASQHSKHGRQEALDLVHRTNVYDRAENPSLPKITLISDAEMPKIKTGTKLEYEHGKVVREGDCDTPQARREDAKREEATRAAESRPSEPNRRPGGPPPTVTEANR